MWDERLSDKGPLSRSHDARGTSTANGCNTRPRSPLVELEGKDRHTEIHVEVGGLKKTKLESLGLCVRLLIHYWGHFKAPLELQTLVRRS